MSDSCVQHTSNTSVSTATQSSCVTAMCDSTACEISLSVLLVSFTAPQINQLTLSVWGEADSVPSAGPQWILFFFLCRKWNSLRGRGRCKRKEKGSEGEEISTTDGWFNSSACFYGPVLHLKNEKIKKNPGATHTRRNQTLQPFPWMSSV